MGAGVKVNFPGYWVETLPSGALRHRVRQAGKNSVKTTLPFGPEHPDFSQHYHAARFGDPLPAPPKHVDRSLDWLTARYLAHLERLVKAGMADKMTHKQRKSLLIRMCDHKDAEGFRYGGNDLSAPTSAFVTLRNDMMETPGAAQNMIKAVKAMYSFAMEEGLTAANPATGIKSTFKGNGGAKPWSADDIKAFVKRHPKGTTAYAWLAVSLFVGCRRDDARKLGRAMETQIGGATYLQFQPGKKGSAPVVIPMLPQLTEAVRALKVEGPTYLLTEFGKPFASSASIGGRIRDWCDSAGLPERSAHGVRKALGGLLAEFGIPTQAISAILAHTNIKTTQVYTAGASRRILSDTAMQAMRNFSL